MSNQTQESLKQMLKVAHTVQTACIDAAQQCYEDAAMSGLCGEGALEAAIGAIRMLDLEALVANEW